MNSLSRPDKTTQYTLLVISTLTVMAGATIAPALPSMQVHFADQPHADFWVKMVLTLPGLFIVLGAYVAGLLIDRTSKKMVLLVSILLYALAGGSGLIADTLVGVLIGRAVLGLGVAGIMTTVITLVADYYSGAERAKVLGLQSSFMALGGVIFLSLGGFLADIHWRMPFAIYLSAAILVPLAWKYILEPQEYPSSRSSTEPAEAPVSTLRLIKLLMFIYGLTIAAQILFYTIPIHLPFHLQSIVGAGGAESGLAIALVTLFSGLTALMYSRIRERVGYVRIMSLAFTLIGLGFLLLGVAKSYVVFIPGLMSIGVGFGMFIPNVNTWIADVAPARYRGRIIGGITTFVFLGQFLSPIVTQSIQKQIGVSGLYLGAGLFLLSSALVMLARRNALILLCRHVMHPKTKPVPPQTKRYELVQSNP
ncbi:MAG: MFS transporter [Bacteroidota bacterium]